MQPQTQEERDRYLEPTMGDINAMCYAIGNAREKEEKKKKARYSEQSTVQKIEKPHKTEKPQTKDKTHFAHNMELGNMPIEKRILGSNHTERVGMLYDLVNDTSNDICNSSVPNAVCNGILVAFRKLDCLLALKETRESLRERHLYKNFSCFEEANTIRNEIETDSRFDDVSVFMTSKRQQASRSIIVFNRGTYEPALLFSYDCETKDVESKKLEEMLEKEFEQAKVIDLNFDQMLQQMLKKQEELK